VIFEENRALKMFIRNRTANLEKRLPTNPVEVGKGKMSLMAKLLNSGAPAELSAEEEAQQKAHMLAVQRELEEADEPNLLEEEDMHVFDREPLADTLSLVSCNLCKKPIKTSQFAAHAERCRSLIAQDDPTTELDGGAGYKKPPRKARKKLLPSQDSHTSAGDSDRLQAVEDDVLLSETAGTSGGGYEDQPPAYGSVRGTKKVMNISEGTVVAAPKVGRPRKAVLVAPGDDGTAGGSGGMMYADATQTAPKRPKILTIEELDTLCGVLNVQTGMMCRRSLTCKLHSESSKRAVAGRRRPFEVLLQEFKANKLAAAYAGKPHDTVVVDPLPMATKVYCLRTQQRMRAVLGSLFRDACNRPAVSNGGNSPDRLSGEMGGQVSAVPITSDLSSDLQKAQLLGFNQKKSAKQRDKKGSPVQVMPMSRVKTEPGLVQSLDYSRMPMSAHAMSGASGHLLSGVPLENGQLAMGKGRPVQGMPVLGTNLAGVQGNQAQQSLGGVSVI